MTIKEQLAAAKRAIRSKIRVVLSADMKALKKASGVKGAVSGNNRKRRKRPKGPTQPTAANVAWFKLFYSYIELATDEYWQLVESRRIISS